MTLPFSSLFRPSKNIPTRGTRERGLSPQFLRSLSAAQKEYESKGFAVIPEVFTPEEINRLRAASLIALTQLGEIKKHYTHEPLETTSKSGFESPALLFWPRLANREFAEFSDDPRLRAVVQAFLGDSVKQLNNQFYYRLPGDGDQFSWHQDIMFRTPLEQYPGVVEEDGYLQTAILVDDFLESNAPVTFIAGSHKLGNLELQKDIKQSVLRDLNGTKLPKALESLSLENLLGKSGSIAVWSSLTAHRSSPNLGLSSRFYLMNGFARARNSRPWPWYMKDGALCDLDPRMIP